MLHVALLVPVAAAWVAPWNTPQQEFEQCDTDIFLDGAQNMNMKGLVLDDITFRYCASRIPRKWPNVKNTSVWTMRLFRSWAPGWPPERRHKVWQNLVDFVKGSNGKVLLGAPVSCDAEADELDWEWTKQLMRLLGKEHILGLAVGNELELLWRHKSISKDCVNELWDMGRLWRTFQSRVHDVDSMGMGLEQLPITSVFTSSIVYSGANSLSFVNIPHQAMVNDFLRNATAKYYSRFVFAVNIYPYFDPTLKVEPPRHTCETAIEIATCFDSPRCLTNRALAEVRRKVRHLVQNDNFRIWIGEIGWSSPKADALSTDMTSCPTFSSMETLQKFYHNFLKWDMSVSAIGKPEADHAFYFTMRDALNFGNQEYFGLIKSCNNAECKLHSKGYVRPELLRRYGWLNVMFAATGSMLVFAALTGASCATIAERRALKHAQLTSDEDSSSSEG